MGMGFFSIFNMKIQDEHNTMNELEHSFHTVCQRGSLELLTISENAIVFYSQNENVSHSLSRCSFHSGTRIFLLLVCLVSFNCTACEWYLFATRQLIASAQSQSQSHLRSANDRRMNESNRLKQRLRKHVTRNRELKWLWIKIALEMRRRQKPTNIEFMTSTSA